MRIHWQISFDDFLLDTGNETIRKGLKPISLRPKTFALLRYLVEHAGRLVSKEELMGALWSNTYVGDDVLKHSIGEIRRALGDDVNMPRYIETAHRRGYRFIGEIKGRREVSGGQGMVEDANGTPSLGKRQLVGRDSELTLMRNWLERTLGGTRQIAFITGEQGIGKTALVDTFLNMIDRNMEIESQIPDSEIGDYQSGVCVARGQCLKLYGTSEPYMPVLEAFTRLCQGPISARVKSVLNRHAPLWLTQMPSVVDGASLEKLKRGLMGATRPRMLREMAEAIEGLSSEMPMILVLEDLHWSDLSTLNLLAYLAQRQEPARLMLLATFRFAEVMGKSHPLKGIIQELQLHYQCQELPLTRLDEAAVAEYLMRRFPEHKLPVEVCEWIHRQTDGDPLFMVSIADHLVTQGAIVRQNGSWILKNPLAAFESSVPATIQQMITRKIEQSSPGEQSVLEAGSVEGVEFSAAAISAALGEEPSRVEELCEGMARRYKFLQSESSHKLSNGTLTLRYKFTHPLYQDICYKGVPETRRTHLHRRIGEYIERAYVDYAGDKAAKLATHFERGRQYGRAIKYFQQAADNANRRYADCVAIDLARRGLQLLDGIPDAPELAYYELKLQIALGIALMATQGFGSEEVKRTFTRALGLSRESSDPILPFSALFGLWRCCRIRGEYTKAQELAEQLVRLGKSEQKPAMESHANHAMAATLLDLGKFDLALEYLKQDIALRNIQEQDSHAFLFRNDSRLTCMCYRALAKWMLGYPDQSLKEIDKAVALAADPCQAHDFVFARYFAALVHKSRRDSKRALEFAQEALAHARQQGLVQWIALISSILGWALAKEGKVTEGIERIHQALASHQQIGSVISNAPLLSTLLAEVLQDAGEIQEGLATVEKVLDMVHRAGNRHYETEIYRLKGELLLCKSETNSRAGDRNDPQSYSYDIDSQEAEACFCKAIEVGRQQRAKLFELRATISLARLWQHQNRKSEARQRLREIYEWFNEGHDTPDLKEARDLIQQLS
jgi:DNA-binding winged helix-turn-helix (wHTH) protein/tetratricopeptide (TPR) repeat protein